MKWFVRTALSCALFTMSLSAADVSGTWKGTVESPAGSVERTFVFRTEGSKLTGETTSQMMGKSDIRNGSVDGDTISFHITISYEGNDVKLNYKGKVEGDQSVSTWKASRADCHWTTWQRRSHKSTR